MDTRCFKDCDRVYFNLPLELFLYPVPLLDTQASISVKRLTNCFVQPLIHSRKCSISFANLFTRIGLSVYRRIRQFINQQIREELSTKITLSWWNDTVHFGRRVPVHQMNFVLLSSNLTDFSALKVETAIFSKYLVLAT